LAKKRKRVQKSDINSSKTLFIILIVVAAFLISGDSEITGAQFWKQLGFGDYRIPPPPPQPTYTAPIEPAPIYTAPIEPIQEPYVEPAPIYTEPIKVDTASATGINIGDSTTTATIPGVEALRKASINQQYVELFLKEKGVPGFENVEGNLFGGDRKFRCICKYDEDAGKDPSACITQTCTSATGKWLDPNDTLGTSTVKQKCFATCGGDLSKVLGGFCSAVC